MTKTCSKCRATYPATREHFTTASKSSKSKDGFHSWCKSCLRKRGREKTPLWSEQRRGRTQADPYRIRGQRLRNGMVTRARELGLPFDGAFFTSVRLTEMLRTTPSCPCCEVEFLAGYEGLAKPLPTPDGLNGSFPPKDVQGNVSLLCFRCNTLKRDATLPELERVVSWLRNLNP